MNKIKIIIRKILGEDSINKIKCFNSFIYYDKFSKYKDVKKIICINTPVHGNMGDHAIVYSTEKFFKDNFKEYKILEIYREDLYKYIKAIKKVVNKDDIIVSVGGGNMGNLWIEEERDRRFVIENFMENRIISMPQTISFTEDENGRRELQKTQKVYNLNKNLTIIAREKKSYEIMKNKFYNCNVILNPDTVLYLNDIFNGIEKERKYIMTCLRNDKEGILGNLRDKLVKKLSSEYKEVFHYDTVINRGILKENREKELFDMFNKFLESKIVITDRLHGMVFSAITKTPCIVTKSLDHKVTGTYEWIKGLNYIKLVDNLEYEEIKPLIEELVNLKEYTKIDLNKEYFSKLKNKLMKL